MKKAIITIIIMVSTLSMFAQNKADRICGVYLVVEKSEVSKVKVSRMANGNFEGKIIWMKEPKFKDGTPKTDIMNPDPNLKKTPADKIVLLHNFKYNADDNEWSGEIYNPVEGKMYKAYAAFENDQKLKVRGYVGLPMFGRSMYWTRVE